MSYADYLTLLRLILVPFFLAAFLIGSYQNALIIFVIAAGTDLIDGTVARLQNKQTSFGAILDPIADKALFAATFTSLLIIKVIPLWFFLLVISRDVAILSGLAYLKIKKISYALKAEMSSKFATLMQIITGVAGFIGFLKPDWQLLGFNFSQVMFPFMIVASVLIIISGLQYVNIGISILKNAKT